MHTSPETILQVLEAKQISGLIWFPLNKKYSSEVEIVITALMKFRIENESSDRVMYTGA